MNEWKCNYNYSITNVVSLNKLLEIKIMHLFTPKQMKHRIKSIHPSLSNKNIDTLTTKGLL